MFINWFTVIAQIVNFLILVWLLRRFLYKPVLKAIEKREKRIADELEEADRKKAEAEKEQKEFQKKKSEIEEQRSSLLEKATKEAEKEQQRLLEEARTKSEELKSRLDKSLQEEQEQFATEVKNKIREEVFAIARKVLADLASRSLEEQITAVFIRKIKELKDKEKQNFISAVKPGSGPLLLKSAFEINTEQQEEIHKTLQDTLKQDFQLKLENNPDIISGIELSANGYKLSWSIAEYLDAIEARFTENTRTTSEEETSKTPEDAR